MIVQTRKKRKHERESESERKNVKLRQVFPKKCRCLSNTLVDREFIFYGKNNRTRISRGDMTNISAKSPYFFGSRNVCTL